jgi:hypothetical protein
MRSFIFGGNTGLTYKDLQKLQQDSYSKIGRSGLGGVGGGLQDAGNAIASIIYENKAKELGLESDKKQQEYNDYFANYLKPQEQEEASSQGAYAPQTMQPEPTAQREITSQPLSDISQPEAQVSYPTNAKDSIKYLIDNFEGGYVEKDGKSGHPANDGINQGANPDLDVKNLTQEQKEQIYTDRYYNAINADSLPENMRYPAFDTAVNHGVGFANKALAQAGNDPQKLINIRQEKYNSLAKDPEHAKYLNGWNNRLDKIEGMYANSTQQPQPTEPMLFPSELPPQPQEIEPQAGYAQEQQEMPQGNKLPAPDMNMALEMLSSPYASEQQKGLANYIITNAMTRLYPDAMTEAKLKGQDLQNQLTQAQTQGQYSDIMQKIKINDAKINDINNTTKNRDLSTQSNINVNDSVVDKNNANIEKIRLLTPLQQQQTEANISKLNAQTNNQNMQARGSWGNPFTVSDKNGNPVLMQQNPLTGETKELNQAKPFTKIDEENLKNKKYAIRELPRMQETASNINKNINNILTDPELPNVLGPLDSITPTFTESSADLESKIGQLQGGAFLTVYEQLRGAGAITDTEGEKATQALLRAETSQSPEEFKNALLEYQKVLNNGVERMKSLAGTQRAGRMPQSSQSEEIRTIKRNPKTGELE